MKKHSLLSLGLSLCILVASCSKDETNDSVDGIDQESKEIRETPIAIAQVTSGVTVQSGSVKDGMPPAPTGQLDISMDTDDQLGYLDAGFNIRVSSTGAPTGAYIVFKDKDGNAQDSYFDVDLSGTGDKKSTQRRKKFGANTSIFNKDGAEEQEIRVVFENTIPTGTFCYDLCLYDAAGNISQIVTRCVVIDKWGGNDSVVGEWKFEATYENGELIDESSNEDEFPCVNGGSVLAEYANIVTDNWILAFEADGDYYEEYEYQAYNIDYEATTNECTAIYETEIYGYHDRYLGKWAYNTVDGLSVVDFAYTDLLDPTENETYETGDLYFEGVAVAFEGDKMILTESYNEEGITYEYKVVFVKN